MIDTEQEVQAWLRLMTSVDKSNQILGLKMLAQIDITDKSSEYKHVNKLLTLFIKEMLIKVQDAYNFRAYNYSYIKNAGMFTVCLYNKNDDYGDNDYVNLVYEISFTLYNSVNFSSVTYMITNDEKYDNSCMYYHKGLKRLCYYDEECELGSNEYNMFNKYNLFFVVREYQCEIKYFEDRFYVELFKTIELL